MDLGFYLIKVDSATFRFELALVLFLNLSIGGTHTRYYPIIFIAAGVVTTYTLLTALRVS